MLAGMRSSGVLRVSRDGLTLVTTIDRASDLKTLIDSLPSHIRDQS